MLYCFISYYVCNWPSRSKASTLINENLIKLHYVKKKLITAVYTLRRLNLTDTTSKLRILAMLVTVDLHKIFRT